MNNYKLINIFCFLLPFCGTVLNVQALSALYISETISQLIAYGFVGLLLGGVALNIKGIGHLSKTAKLWFAFYLFYYAFGTLASVLRGNAAPILSSIIPLIYVLGFHVYLSDVENRKLFDKVALVALLISCILCIYLAKINWSLDYSGIHKYTVDRAGGVYGDANSAALVSLLSFFFTYKRFNPIKPIHKYLKIILLLVAFYSLVLTFSTTGFFVFTISFALLNYKFFSPNRIILVIVLMPFLYLTLINLNELVAGFDLTTPQRDKISNIVNMLTLNTQEVDNSGRGALLDNLLKYVYESPIIGNGIDFTVSIKGHNTVVGVMADAGIFTLLVFFFMLGSYYVNALKSIPEIRFFVLPILIALCVFMLSLQSVINQGYLMALFVYVAYLIDFNQKKYMSYESP